MILLTVNPKQRKNHLMSFNGIFDQDREWKWPVQEAKLNAAYANGGAELAISTIQR